SPGNGRVRLPARSAAHPSRPRAWRPRRRRAENPKGVATLQPPRRRHPRRTNGCACRAPTTRSARGRGTSPAQPGYVPGAVRTTRARHREAGSKTDRAGEAALPRDGARLARRRDRGIGPERPLIALPSRSSVPFGVGGQRAVTCESAPVSRMTAGTRADTASLVRHPQLFAGEVANGFGSSGIGTWPKPDERKVTRLPELRDDAWAHSQSAETHRVSPSRAGRRGRAHETPASGY